MNFDLNVLECVTSQRNPTTKIKQKRRINVIAVNECVSFQLLDSVLCSTCVPCVNLKKKSNSTARCIALNFGIIISMQVPFEWFVLHLHVPKIRQSKPSQTGKELIIESGPLSVSNQHRRLVVSRSYHTTRCPRQEMKKYKTINLPLHAPMHAPMHASMIMIIML